MPDRERNRLTRRLTRYARVSANVGGVAARMAGARLFGRDLSDPRNATDLAGMLGGLKGPLMKIAQMIATVPDLLPPEFATELQKLQSAAPPMGARAGMGEPLPLLRAPAGGGGLARPGAQGDRSRRR